jgi:hypothetical protein
MGWPTQFVGPFTGALVSVLTTVVYQRRTKRRAPD